MERRFFCAIKLKDIKAHDRYVEKPDWCPLRELKKKNTGKVVGDYLTGKVNGYNACIDELLEDKE